MDNIKILNAFISKGLIGAANEWVHQYRQGNDESYQVMRRIKLTQNNFEVFHRLDKRIKDTIDEVASGNPLVDKQFEMYSQPFVQAMCVAMNLIKDSKTNHLDRSVWLVFKTNLDKTSFFTIQFCNTDGKKIRSFTTISDLYCRRK